MQTTRPSRTRPSHVAMPTVEATNEICVAGHIVTAFAVTGSDDAGQLMAREMVPLTTSGARYRGGMLWAVKAMRDMRPTWFTSSSRGRAGGWHHDFMCAPVVVDILAAINELKGKRQRLTRLVDVTGAPLSTCRTVNVRGKKVAVATAYPILHRALPRHHQLAPQ